VKRVVKAIEIQMIVLQGSRANQIEPHFMNESTEEFIRLSR